MPQPKTFIPSRTLSRQLAREIESPFRALFPDVPFALALIGPGSDVLGFDTDRSMDHDWGPRITVVVCNDEVDIVRLGIDENLSRLMPPEISGFPTRFTRHEDGTLKADTVGTMHRMQVTSIPELLRNYLLIGSVEELSVPVWLSTPMQSLLELTAGDVFLDDTGELGELRAQLSFYPDSVWRYQLAALWMSISQIQPFIGRTGEVGDKAGSAVITASIARHMMMIALLQSRRYAPYAKWLGSASATTAVGLSIQAKLAAALTTSDWQDRERSINEAGIELIRRLNDLALIDTIEASVQQFHSRPFHVLRAEEIALALNASLAGSDCEGLPPFVGGIDIVSDSTDARKSEDFRTSLRAMYAAEP